MDTYLSVKWTTSRGRDTYGYNICTVRDTSRGTRYACNGGNYDMQGTSFAEWLENTYQERLVEIKHRAHNISDAGRYNEQEGGDLYGMTSRTRNKGIILDGACGLSSMIKIAEAIDLEVHQVYTRRGSLEGMYITDKRRE